MHQVYNMGHRLEILVEPSMVDKVMQLVAHHKVEARIVGRTEASAAPGGANHVTLRTAQGELTYGPKA
jgi:phosphoribosylformylglycinamidine cyclo-ligase